MDASPSTSSNDQLRQERIRRNWRQQDLADHLGTTVVTVGRWERGSQQPSAYFRIKLCALFCKSAEELGLVPKGLQPAAPPRAEAILSAETIPFSHAAGYSGQWNVPHRRNPFFTGREDFLHTLHEQLNREHRMALTQSWAISGLGGIGKTQIALEYAYRYRHEYRSVFWMSAATQETLLSGLVIIAECLHLLEQNEHDQNKVRRAVKLWLTSHQEWLLILDNADDLPLISDVIPTELSGHLLLTTRAQALGTLAQRVEVETMGMVEGTLFLFRRAKLLVPDAFLDQVSEKELAVAEAIVIEMDFLPLALDQAGAYIEEVGCSLSAYLELYRTHRRELLQRRGQMPSHHPEPVATTWSLSFEKIEQANPAAAELLCLCAFLEPDAIPEELISEGSASFSPILGSVAMDALLLDEAIQELRKFSLVQRDPENRLLRVHRLVQAVLKDTMEAQEQHQWAERAIRATTLVFPKTIEMTTWPRCRRFLPQAQECTRLIQDFDFTFEEAASLLFRTATYLYDYALYEQAEPLLLRTLHIRKQILGPTHPDVARTINNLARLYCMQGKFEQAEPLFQQALPIMELSMGLDHPDLALLLNNLANLSCMQGKYAQAEPLFLRSLHIREQAFGPNHREVAQPLNNLANLYYEQGKYEQVEPLYLKALCIWEKALGPTHPDVSHPLHGLANLYRDQRKYVDGERLYQRALDIRELSLGKQHPATAEILHDFAVFQEAQGNNQEAASMYQRALTIREQVLGTHHPTTSDTRKRLRAVLGKV